MTPDSIGPLTRPLPLGRVTSRGTDHVVEADAEERAALAADLGLSAIHSLVARLHVAGTPDRVRVAGRVNAKVDQICVVTLDPFPATVEEEVEIEFRVPDRRPRANPAEIDLDPVADGPEELTGDHLDLGAIASEFLALGLDPYPRKPGVAFELPDGGEAEAHPFARLAELRPKDPDPA